MPFGETLVDEHLNSNKSPFCFNAKELDEATGNYYYGARYYNPKCSTWLSVDPLAEKYPSWSPYNYTMNNPIKFVDPDGLAAFSPIYDSDGELLGTDDQGLQGEAIVMDEKDFKQGMSHEEAKSKDKGVDSIEGEEAQNKFKDSYNNLSERPDWDGKVTISEANKWYRDGNSGSLYADLSKIDFDFIKPSDFNGKESKYFQTLYDSEDGSVYGQLKLERVGNNQVKSNFDIYNFERHHRGDQSNLTAGQKIEKNFKLMLRNMATFIGRVRANRSPVNKHRKGFKIKFLTY